MAATIPGISDPVLIIDDVTIKHVPNSLSLKVGFGDIKVRPESAGGGVFDNVITRDGSTATSSLTFKIYPTSANINNILAIQENYGKSTVLIVDFQDSNVSWTISGASIITDPTLNLNADDGIEVEMKGNTAVYKN
jgi:hypothetical protein